VSLQSWGETLVSAQVDGTALTNSVTRASIIPPAAIYTLPANFFSIGKVLRVNFWGRMSNVVTTPGTLTLEVFFGATSVFSGGAIALNTTAKTNVTCRGIIMLTCRAIGASANLMGTGDFTSESVVSSAANTANDAMMPATAPAVGSNFDSTASQAVDLRATFSVSTATTSIQLHQYALEALN
jgi:hypothetical protein